MSTRLRDQRYFPTLDGLRAVSVTLVLAEHSPGTLFKPLHGRLGVTIFFVLSGFLITTLLLREEAAFGGVSLRGFYQRRAFRIFPLYFLALATFSAAVAAHLGENPGDYDRRLLHFLTFTNEWAAPGTFGHSWSLGVEEKFYLVWPLLAFLGPAFRRSRLVLAMVLTLAASVLGLARPDEPLSFYSPILVGCLVAMLLHAHEDLFVVGWQVLLLPVGLLSLSTPGRVNVFFGFLTGVALIAIVLRTDHPAVRWLRMRPLVFVGRRSYAIYLFHPLVGSLIAKVLHRSNGIWPVVYLTAMFAGTLILADVLYRWLERPLMRMGHRLTQSSTAPDEPRRPTEGPLEPTR